MQQQQLRAACLRTTIFSPAPNVRGDYTGLVWFGQFSFSFDSFFSSLSEITCRVLSTAGLARWRSAISSWSTFDCVLHVTSLPFQSSISGCSVVNWRKEAEVGSLDYSFSVNLVLQPFFLFERRIASRNHVMLVYIAYSVRTSNYQMQLIYFFKKKTPNASNMPALLEACLF